MTSHELILDSNKELQPTNRPPGQNDVSYISQNLPTTIYLDIIKIIKIKILIYVQDCMCSVLIPGKSVFPWFGSQVVSEWNLPIIKDYV